MITGISNIIPRHTRFLNLHSGVFNFIDSGVGGILTPDR